MSKKNHKCIIFSAPSGAGKTTIVHHLLRHNKNLSFSISACSRLPRKNEMDGVDYYFFPVEIFKEKIKNNEFVEWEEVYTNNFYGTLKSEIERIWKANKTVVFDVDVVGGLNLKNIFKEQALAVFVQPPSIEVLEKRLRNRSTESEEKIQIRMAKAKEELSKASFFDVILLNENLENACAKAEKLVDEFINN